MSDQMLNPYDPNQPAPGSKTQTNIDALKLQHLMDQIRADQNLSLAMLGGLLAAIAGAIAWAALTYATNWQAAFVAIGIGWLVGYAVRKLGQGIDISFSITGAVMALVGVVLGNLLYACAYIAEDSGASVWEVLSTLTIEDMGQIMTSTFNPVDLLFYGVAVYYAYKMSIRRLTADEIKSVQRPA